MVLSRKIYVILSCLSMLLVEFCECQHFNESRRLKNDLLNNYDREIRPGLDHSTPTVVNMTIYLIQFIDFDERTGIFSTVIVLALEWYDHRMSWNPYDYGNLTSVPLLQGNVWKPYVINVKQVSGFKELCSSSCPVRYRYDGKAGWSPGDVYDGSCDVNMEDFPFDKQTCDLRFTAWGFSPGEIFINSTTERVIQDLFIPNGIWNVEATYISTSVPVSNLQFVIVTITFSRKPQFFVVNIIFPLMCIGLLNIAVFKLPAESGERIGYVITSLLSVTVYITSVSEMLPRTNQPALAMINYLLLIYLLMSSCIVFCTILTLSYYNKQDKPVSAWINRCIKVVYLCFRKDSVEPVDSNVTQYKNFNKNGDDNVSHMLNQAEQNKAIDTIDQPEVRNTSQEKSGLTCDEFGEILDNVFFVFYLLVYIISNAVYFSRVLK